MRYVFALFLLCLLAGGPVLAQTPAPAQHFSLSGSVVSFMSPAGSTPASIVDGYFNLTGRVSVGYQQITVPSLATARLGIVAYSAPLSSFVGKKLTGKFVFDASKITLTILGGAGKLSQDVNGVDRIAETAGVCVNYPVGSNVSIKLACGQWLHGGIVNGLITNAPIPGSVSSASSTAAVSSGITIHF